MRIPSWLTIDLLERMRTEGEDNPSRARYIKVARSCNKHYYGNAGIIPTPDFDDMLIDKAQATSRMNKIKQTIDKENSILLKNIPIVRRWPLLEDDAALADGMDALFLQAWEETHGQQVLRSLLLEAQIAGLGVAKVFWDPLNTYSGKTGQIAIEKLTPESVIWDPQTSNMHRGLDCRYIIHHTKMPIYWFLEKFKDEGAKVLGLRDNRSSKTKSFLKNINQSVRTFISSKERDQEDSEKVDVYEYWIYPHTMYASELVADSIKPSDFPNGLVVTMTNNTILEDRVMPNPFMAKKSVQVQDDYGYPKNESREIGHKRHPFVPLWWSRVTDPEGDGIYGLYDCAGAVEQMISIQFNIDALRRNIVINSRTIANPTIIANPDAIMEKIDSIKFTHGQILTAQNNVNLEDTLRVLQGTPLPQQVFELLINDINEIEKAAGVEPGVVGLFSPGGTSHTPAMTIGALQESAFGPLWMFVSEISDALLDMSVLYDGLIQQKYPSDRYTTVSRTGERFYVEWSDRHITANFKRRIVNGSTTPLFDVEKDSRTASVAGVAMQACMSNNPVIIQLAIAQIEALNYPWAYQFIQILKDHLNKLTQMEQGMEMLGAMDLAGQGQEMPAGEAMPEEGIDYSGIDGIGEELGISPEQLVAGIESLE